MNAVPTVPLADVVLVMTGWAAAMVSAREAFPVPRWLAASIVTVHIPAAVGFPEIRPVLLLIVSPVGNPVAE